MELYSSSDGYKLYHGNMLDMLEVVKPESVDSIITDPPYELNFMGKGWDNSGIAFQKTTWQKCYSALKAGGYLLAFGGTRTFHRIAVAIEDAGFEIRDTIMWLYGSGFPKSMDIGKSIEAKLTTGSANTQEFKNLNGTKAEKGNWGIARGAYEQGARPSNYDEDGQMRTEKVEYTTEEGAYWDGWGTALKPAFEPIIVARKPCDGSTTDNVLKYGVGGINIDECRVGNEIIGGGTIPSFRDVGKKSKDNVGIDKLSFGQVENAERVEYDTHEGRFPSNVILTYDNTDEKEVCGGMPDTVGGKTNSPLLDIRGNKYNSANTYLDITYERGYDDSGNASRYYYCAKASKKDRDEGLKSFTSKSGGTYNFRQDGSLDGAIPKNKNMHPTVKPTALMQYLVRLVTPNGGTVLDPFNGSGSTGKAVMYENVERNKGYKYIGIELTEQYLPISRARIEYAESGALAEFAEDGTLVMKEPPVKQRRKNLLRSKLI